MMSHRTTVPAAAKWLGAAGLLPFFALAAGGLLLQGQQRADSITALLAYGAAILSFLGGIQWGLAISDADGEALGMRLGISVVPSLIAWVGLLLPPQMGLLLLAATILAVLLADLRASRAGHAPAWYPALRLPLSTGAALSLLLGAMA